MEDVGVKSLCTLAAILYGVIGVSYTFSETEKEVITYFPSNTSGNFSSWDCGRNNSFISFKSLHISPDPIVFTDNLIGTHIKINGVYEVKENISTESKIEVDINLRLRTPQGFTELCDLVGDEKCHVDDLMKSYNTSFLLHPLKKGNHTVPNVRIHLYPLPFILKGTFETTMYIRQRGHHIGCLGMRFCVTECRF